ITIVEPIATDGVISTVEASGDILVTGTVTIPDDAVMTSITVIVNGNTYNNANLSTTNGLWSIVIPGSAFIDGAGDVKATATFTDVVGNTINVTDTATYT